MSRRTAIVLAAIATLVLGVALQRLDNEMNDEGGHGIVAFEYAGSKDRAAEIKADWGPDGRDAAKKSLWLDYLYLIAYGTLGTLAALAVRDSARRRGWRRMAAFGRFAAPAAAGAAVFDALEDVGLLLALGGHGGEAAPLTAAICASLKFFLVAVVIAYLLAGLVLRLRQGPAG